MVECELVLFILFWFCGYSFNRYMVECELYPRTFAIRRMKVLIDTWWNVNLDISIFEEKCNTRFNRYMVECEFQFLNRIFCHFLVLIDTWWNVNMTRWMVIKDRIVF